MARQRFTAEFKREAVRLLKGSDEPVTQLAAEAGVPRNRLYKRRDALHAQGEHAFPGPGRHSLQQLEMTRLKRELAQLKEENLILKQTTAYFASGSRGVAKGSEWTTPLVLQDEGERSLLRREAEAIGSNNLLRPL